MSPSILSISSRPSTRSRPQSPVPGPTARRYSPLGGDHTVALPILRSLARDHGPLAVLHFDAHLDTWDTYFGALYTHGTPFRRASEEGLLDLERCLHMGIRGPLFASTDLEDDARSGVQRHPCRRLRSGRRQGRRRPDAQQARRRTGLRVHRHRCPRPSPRTRHRHTRSRRPDQPRTARHHFADCKVSTLSALTSSKSPPAYDHAEITGIAAAHVAYELLSVLAHNKLTALNPQSVKQHGG